MEEEMMQQYLFGGPELPYTLHPRVLADVDPEELTAALPLTQATIRMYGRDILVPRLEAWFGSQTYRYGGQVREPQPWPAPLVNLRTCVYDLTGHSFDSCFANLYRTGEDCIAWHADDEDWIGPWIASVSLGASRLFVIRRKDDHKEKHNVLLHHGDVLLMHPGMQAEWEHTLPRDRSRRARLNLTFRQTRT